MNKQKNNDGLTINSDTACVLCESKRKVKLGQNKITYWQQWNLFLG